MANALGLILDTRL